MFPYDLPFLAGERPARALGRRRVSVSRRAGSQLHQAAGRAARRDDPDLSRRRLREECRAATVSASPQAVAASSRRCRSLFTTTAISRRRSAARPNGSGGEASRRLEGSYDPATSRYRVRWEPARTNGSSLRYRHLVPDPEQWEAIHDDRRCRGRRGRRSSPTSTRTTPTCRRSTTTCSTTSSDDQEGAWMQPHWVGDLTLAGESRGRQDRAERVGSASS